MACSITLPVKCSAFSASYISLKPTAAAVCNYNSATATSCSYTSSTNTFASSRKASHVTMEPTYTSIPVFPASPVTPPTNPAVEGGRFLDDGVDHTNTSRIPPEAELATVWRDIQGASDWSGLVEPLHPLLRSEILRYGQLINACYKAIDLDPASKRYLNCKYGKRALLKEATAWDGGAPSASYEVTKYVYAATPDFGLPGFRHYRSAGERWIGYVAVSDDTEARRLGRRDVLVAFRGTVTPGEWAANLMSSMTPARLDPHDPRPDVKVESGFHCLYTNRCSHAARFGHGSCREQLLGEITRLLDLYKEQDVSVTVAGHSMGSSLALILAYDLAELGILSHNTERRTQPTPVTVYSFGGPRVGNLGFRRRCQQLGVKVLRVVNVNDPVTKLPGVFVNETSHCRQRNRFLPYWNGGRDCYAHVGVEVPLDFFPVNSPAGVHDLGHYLAQLRCQPTTPLPATVVKSNVIGIIIEALCGRWRKE